MYRESIPRAKNYVNFCQEMRWWFLKNFVNYSGEKCGNKFLSLHLRQQLPVLGSGQFLNMADSILAPCYYADRN